MEVSRLSAPNTLIMSNNGAMHPLLWLIPCAIAMSNSDCRMVGPLTSEVYWLIPLWKLNGLFLPVLTTILHFFYDQWWLNSVHTIPWRNNVELVKKSIDKNGKKRVVTWLQSLVSPWKNSSYQIEIKLCWKESAYHHIRPHNRWNLWYFSLDNWFTPNCVLKQHHGLSRPSHWSCPKAGNKKALAKSAIYPRDFGVAIALLVPKKGGTHTTDDIDISYPDGSDHLGSLDDLLKGSKKTWWRKYTSNNPQR